MLLTLFEKKQEAKDVMSFKFKSDEPLNWRAGQYLFYTFPNNNPDNRGTTRYFTISSSPFEKYIMITTRISKPSSTFKKSLTGMKIGNRITASGPDGDFTVGSDSIGVGDPKKNYVFIAGGIGITPFRSILLDLDHKNLPVNVQLLYANRDKEIVFKGELKSLKSRNPRLPKPGTGGQANFKIQYFISHNRIDDKTLSSIINHKSSIINLPSFYISGPEPFVESIGKILNSLGVKPLNIKLDEFPGYKW